MVLPAAALWLQVLCSCYCFVFLLLLAAAAADPAPAGTVQALVTCYWTYAILEFMGAVYSSVYSETLHPTPCDRSNAPAYLAATVSPCVTNRRRLSADGRGAGFCSSWLS